LELLIKETPLVSIHKAMNAKMVPFAGWNMPVLYKGIIEEHRAVRENAGIFDVSHMGEILITGDNAEKAVEYFACNDVGSLPPGKAQYSALLNEQGGVIDDVIVYKYSPKKILLCVNASNKDTDYRWLLENNQFDVSIKDVSDAYGLLAVQGPNALKILSGLDEAFKDIEEKYHYYSFHERSYHVATIIVAYTGYTGEKGLELFVPKEKIVELWEQIVATEQVTPCGLGARDTLRLEAAYALHGHELSPGVNAFESGLGWIVKLKKEVNFIGKQALQSLKGQGIEHKLCGFMLEDNGIARQFDTIYSAPEDGAFIGEVTSGTKTPTINRSIGLCRIKADFAVPGTVFYCKVRERFLKGTIAAVPFYSKTK
jgi:aminomethyltransferase